jgi:segregation and condensation protein A
VLEEDRLQRFARGNIQQELAKMAVSTESGYAGELNALTLYKLIATFEKVMHRFEDNQNRVIHTVVQYPFTIDNEKDSIKARLFKKPQLNFNDIFEDCTSKLHAVFTFLALLELLQNRMLYIFVGEGYNNFVISTPESAPDKMLNPEDAN